MIETNTQVPAAQAGTADSELMRLATAETERRRGAMSPNPRVGAALAIGAVVRAPEADG